MAFPVPSATLALRLAVALLVGLAIGTEREWSGPTSGAARRFAGLRTFLLLGAVGGIAGLLLASPAALAGSVLLAAGSGLTLVAYAMSLRRTGVPLDGTTEAAALVVLALGALAGLGETSLAAGCGAITVFALGRKERLHALVAKIGEREMHAALEFLVLALVVLPLLPAGPIHLLWDFRPRALWSIVLLLSAINFASYLAQRAVGPGRGYAITGAIAGLISSTALTLQFSRLSRHETRHARGPALGVLMASTVLPLRLLAVAFVVEPGMLRQLIWYAVPAAAIGALSAFAIGRHAPADGAGPPPAGNPLRLGAALPMAIGFEAAFVLIGLARAQWGATGITGSSFLLGLADLDALTVSLSRMASDPALAATAGRGIGIGMLANTCVKLALVLLLGAPTVRRLAGSGLAATLLVLGGVLWWRW